MAKTVIRKTSKPTEIQSAVIYRCTDKVTRTVYYLVPSDSQSGTYYTVQFDRVRLAWRCSCPAHKPCKHERAVQEVLRLRRERIAHEVGGDMPVVMEVENCQCNRELDSIDQERVAWSKMTKEERRACYSATFDLGYGDVA